MNTSKDAMVQLRNASGCELTCHTARLCRDQRQAAKVKLRNARSCEQTNRSNHQQGRHDQVSCVPHEAVGQEAAKNEGLVRVMSRFSLANSVGQREEREKDFGSFFFLFFFLFLLDEEDEAVEMSRFSFKGALSLLPCWGERCSEQSSSVTSCCLAWSLLFCSSSSSFLPSGSQRSSREEEEGGGVDPQPPGPPTPWPPDSQPCAPGLRPPGAAQDQSRLLAESPLCPSSVPVKLRATAL